MEGAKNKDMNGARNKDMDGAKNKEVDGARNKEMPNVISRSCQENDDGSEVVKSGPRCGTRHVLVVWAFLGLATVFIQRVIINITMVDMASASPNASQPSSSSPALNTSLQQCPRDPQNDSTPLSTAKPAEFEWSNTLQGFVLSAFYYGYFISQIPSSFLASRIGGKLMFAIAVGGCSALTAVTPLSARLHPGVLIANRILQGSLQGVVFPAFQLMLSKWAPATERSWLLAFSYAGCQAGTVAGMLGAGYICDTSAGWPLVFYVAGGVGCVWCVGWMVFISDSPLHHPRISEEERNYILRSVGNCHLKTPSVPWRGIVTSPALYGIAAAHFANDWGCFAVMTCLPRFMKDVLNYDISSNGFLSSLPYLVMWVSNLIAGALADCLRKPHLLKTVHVRKMMVLIGLLGPASLLLWVAYYPGCERGVMVVLLTLAVGLSGFTIAGHSVNHLDIAPVFAGLLFAITNSVGTTSGWIGPALAGALTEHNSRREGWQRFFVVSGAVYAAGGATFLLLARGEVQAWATTDLHSPLLLPSPSYGSAQAPDDHVTDDEE